MAARRGFSEVTVTRLPVTRCAICQKTMAHQPGQAAAVLTEHYEREHPEVTWGGSTARR